MLFPRKTRYHTRMRLPPLPFTVFDTETTGFVPRTHHIIEFASMTARGGEVVDEYEQLLSVDGEIPPHVQVLTHIKPEDIAGKPTFTECMDEMTKRIGEDTLLVGQNLGYDLGMMRGDGIDLTARPWIDTSMLASVVFPEFESYSLQYMSNYLKLNHAPAHRALGDVRATTELLGHIWERLLELSAEELAFAKGIMERSSEGYKMLFAALPPEGGKGATWIKNVTTKKVSKDVPVLPLPVPTPGHIALLEESLDPDTIQSAINAASKDDSMTHWIAVKNLEGTLRRVTLPDNVRAIHPPSLLADPAAVKTLLAQEAFTGDEATLALKLHWFRPRTRNDVALHGGEKDVWGGKIACTHTSDAYTMQFKEKAAAFVIDHRQLFALLSTKGHASAERLSEHAHIVIDDASMLEDTATKAYGIECFLDDVRGAALGNDKMMAFTDLLMLWAEKIRGMEETHYLTQADYDRPETLSMIQSLEEFLGDKNLPEQTVAQLSKVRALLTKNLLKEQLVWTERRMNGSLSLNAAPLHIDLLLKVDLYDRFPTTLLIPQGTNGKMPEVVPARMPADLISMNGTHPYLCPIRFPQDETLKDFFANPPAGKTIILAGSKRIIEQAFIDHTERFEKEGITLICQGLNGGQGRMESDFAAAEGTAIWMLTPWMYEGIDQPEGTVDRLIIDTLPFDHPNHPIASRRKEHYGNGFEEYLLPRVQHRLFRLLRTFCRHRKDGGEAVLIDKRLHEKSYGTKLMNYLSIFAENADIPEPKPASAKATTDKPAKKAAPKKKDDGQLQLPI